MIEYLVVLTFVTLYGYFDAISHSWVGRLLQFMQYRPGQKEHGKFAKGKYHTTFAIARTGVWLAVSSMWVYFHWGEVWYMLALPCLTYGLTIALAHEVVNWDGISFKINVTCEKWGTGFDTDCIVIWFRDKLGINIWVIGAVVLIASIITYIIELSR